jgi:hypothetical protein
MSAVRKMGNLLNFDKQDEDKHMKAIFGICAAYTETEMLKY